MSIILENDSVFPQHENGSSALEISENNKARRWSCKKKDEEHFPLLPFHFLVQKDTTLVFLLSLGEKFRHQLREKLYYQKQLSLPVKTKDAGEKKVLVRPTLSSSVKKVVSVIPKHSVKRDSQPKGQNKVVKEEINNYQNKARKLSRNGILTAGLSAPPADQKLLGRAKKGIHATQLPQSSEKNLVIHIKDVTTQVIRRAPLSSSALSKSSHSSASCECHESDIMNTVANKLPSKTRPRKGGPENRTSKGLRFRRRALNDGQMAGEVDTRKNNLKNKEVCGSEANITKMESEKVVLRHKDVQEKKIVQSLLNNLIEETACKLVENRKSKVKALVSAFETVISLQDSTTSSTFCAC
ncbi:hypothetical protein OIU77_000633 [Salix suchowensis]|uniref:Calmodulin-binding domain-containing protein n=1 Tax=Salix suchowensis TaxID=1278906 RepID=A0ABQ9B8S3_9ROSI|nr:hypothetical protein OIU77_000633 [Salix suchowensis]